MYIIQFISMSGIGFNCFYFRNIDQYILCDYYQICDYHKHTIDLVLSL